LARENGALLEAIAGRVMLLKSVTDGMNRNISGLNDSK
jgi:hypothetical protein